MAKYSLFDSHAISAHTAGLGNRVGDASAFFVDISGSDYRPGASSLALDGGEPGIVTDDFLGRPRPAGSADIGAYESP